MPGAKARQPKNAVISAAQSSATLAAVSRPVARESPGPLAPVHGPLPTGSKGLTALQSRGDIPSATTRQGCPPSLAPSAKQCGVEGQQQHHRDAAPSIQNGKRLAGKTQHQQQGHARQKIRQFGKALRLAVQKSSAQFSLNSSSYFREHLRMYRRSSCTREG